MGCRIPLLRRVAGHPRRLPRLVCVTLCGRTVKELFRCTAWRSGHWNILRDMGNGAAALRLKRLGVWLLRFGLLLFRLFLLLRAKLPPVLWGILCRVHRCIAFSHLDRLPIRGKLLFRVALGNMDFFTRGLIVQHRAIAGHALGELIAGLKFFQWVSPPICPPHGERNQISVSSVSSGSGIRYFFSSAFCSVSIAKDSQSLGMSHLRIFLYALF